MEQADRKAVHRVQKVDHRFDVDSPRHLGIELASLERAVPTAMKDSVELITLEQLANGLCIPKNAGSIKPPVAHRPHSDHLPVSRAEILLRIVAANAGDPGDQQW